MAEVQAMPGAPPGAANPALSKIKPQPNHPPNPTLYLSNIDWSIKKPLLKRSLLALFSRHGKVLEVICLRGDAPGSGGKRPLRGQAWVIFESLAAATAALQAERGFVFFTRPLMVNYAKEVSDRIAKRDGSYGAKTKERRVAKRKIGDAVDEGAAPEKMTRFEDGAAPSGAVTTSVNDPSSLVPPPSTQSAADSGSAKKSGPRASSTPSSLLLAKELPTECNDMMLAMLFRVYSGYKEVKLLGGGMAIIEFGTENDATSALKGLNGFKLTSSASLDLSYGER